MGQGHSNTIVNQVLLFSLVLVLIFVIYTRRHRTESYAAGVDPNDDVRENIIHYDEEGVGM